MTTLNMITTALALTRGARILNKNEVERHQSERFLQSFPAAVQGGLHHEDKKRVGTARNQQRRAIVHKP